MEGGIKTKQNARFSQGGGRGGDITTNIFGKNHRTTTAALSIKHDDNPVVLVLLLHIRLFTLRSVVKAINTKWAYTTAVYKTCGLLLLIRNHRVNHNLQDRRRFIQLLCGIK